MPEKHQEVWMLAPSTIINEIPWENKPKVLKIIWTHIKMLFGTTEGHRVCKWNIFFGFICDFLGPKLKVTRLRSISPQLIYVSSKRDSYIRNSRIITKLMKKAKEAEGSSYHSRGQHDDWEREYSGERAIQCNWPALCSSCLSI